MIKLQNMSVIFVIIIIPIILILAVYTRFQINIIKLQTLYDAKLNEAVYDTVKTFQVNTLRNEYATVSDSLRRDINAAASSFTTSLATSFGVGGYSDKFLKPYVPALVFTLYDGYYIYTPTYNEQTGSYEHMLKPYIYYSTRYVKSSSGIDVVINYTLDNFILIYGKINGELVTKSGYLINTTNNVGREVLKEQIVIDGIKQEYYYILEKHDETGGMTKLKEKKLYYDQAEQKFFYILNATIDKDLSDELNDQLISLGIKDRIYYGTEGFYYMKSGKQEPLPDNINTVLINMGLTDKIDFNSTTKRFYYTVTGDTITYIKDEENRRLIEDDKLVVDNIPYDNSAELFMDANRAFTEWVKAYLGDLTPSDIVDSTLPKDDVLLSDHTSRIFYVDSNNDPEKETSIFNNHRREIVKHTIQSNLESAIATYNEHSGALNTNYNFKLPILTETDWDYVLSNISVIGFLQGLPLGIKYYNNYAIVPNTKNREYISQDNLFFLASDTNSYHRIDCAYLQGSRIEGYKNIDFLVKSFEDTKKSEINYYYAHPENACYYCVVNSSYNSEEYQGTRENNPYKLNIFDQTDPNYNSSEYQKRRIAYYTALTRERYNKYKTNEYLSQY